MESTTLAHGPRMAKGLATLRRAKGMTQRQLAAKALLSERTLNRLEHLRHPPTRSTAVRLAKALSVGVEQVLA